MASRLVSDKTRVVKGARIFHRTGDANPKEIEMSLTKLTAKFAEKLEHARAAREFERALDEAPTPASRHELELIARR